jgi:response regulator NasT
MDKPSKLLVVDDDRIVAATITDGLRQAGFRAEMATTGHDGLQRALQLLPDMVLLDMRIPDLSGLDVAHWLREANLPFIFLSAYGDEKTVACATRAGAIGYLVKPLTVSQIVPAIQAALDRSSEIRKLRKSEAQLSEALVLNREVSLAIGMLMERHRTDRKSAYEMIRNRARSERRKVREVAAELIAVLEA